LLAALLCAATLVLLAGPASGSPSKRCGTVGGYHVWAHNVSCSYARYNVARHRTGGGFRCYTNSGSNVPFYCFARGGPYPREGRQYWAAR
jgi:hypothetical protein